MTFEDLPADGPIFIASFNSACANCEFPIKEGQQARFNKDDDVVHVNCPTPRPVCTTCWLVHGITQEDCDG